MKITLFFFHSTDIAIVRARSKFPVQHSTVAIGPAATATIGSIEKRSESSTGSFNRPSDTGDDVVIADVGTVSEYSVGRDDATAESRGESASESKVIVESSVDNSGQSEDGGAGRQQREQHVEREQYAKYADADIERWRSWYESVAPVGGGEFCGRFASEYDKIGGGTNVEFAVARIGWNPRSGRSHAESASTWFILATSESVRDDPRSAAEPR